MTTVTRQCNIWRLIKILAVPFNRLPFCPPLPCSFPLEWSWLPEASFKEDPAPPPASTPSLVCQTLIFIPAMTAPLLLAFPSPLCSSLGAVTRPMRCAGDRILTLPRGRLLLHHFSAHYQAWISSIVQQGPLWDFGVFLVLSAPNRHENETFNPDSSDISLWNPRFLQVGIFQLRIVRDFVGWVFVCLWWLTTRVSSMPWLWGYLLTSVRESLSLRLWASWKPLGSEMRMREIRRLEQRKK